MTRAALPVADPVRPYQPSANTNVKVRIVLADTHGRTLGKDQPSPNLGLLYIAAYLRRAMPQAEVAYIPQKYRLDDHLRVLQRTSADFYAISLTSYGAPVAYDACRRVREAFPDIQIVLGGAHPSASPRETLERSGADVVVIGEGEQTFLELVREGALPEDLGEVQGIAFLRDGTFVRTPARKMIDNLDFIPDPDRSLIRNDDYVGVSFSKARPNTEMIVTRGCPYRCVFCANPVFRQDGGPLYRARSPESIAAEAEELYKQGYRELYLHSDELNVRLDWSIEVCKALAALRHPDLYFQCNMRVAPMTEELAHWLKRANFWLIRYGIESANMRVLTGTKKKMSLSQTEYACRIIAEAGLKVWAYFLIFQFWEDDGELCWETPSEVRTSIAFAKRLAWRRWLHYTSWSIPIPVHGAEFHEIALRHGMIDEDYYPDDSWDPSPFIPELTSHELSRLVRRTKLLQGSLALINGGVEWRNWRKILHAARILMRGRGAEG